ncbi:MAG TPA: cobalamin biosynthesis protein [Bacillota bacterium]
MGKEFYIIAHTERGARLGEDIANRVDAILRVPQRFSGSGGKHGFRQPLSSEVRELFSIAKVLILIMDLETAVRILAPLLSSRASDPVVLVIDENGNFVINLLSGYNNEVNQLVQRLADNIGAQAVLTSLVEKQSVPLLEELSRQYRMQIESRELIPRFTNAFRNGEPMVVWDRWGLNIQWPEHVRVENGDDLQFGNNEKLLLIIGYQNPPVIIPVSMQVMALRPACLTVGIACSKGVTGLRVAGVIRRFFREQNWSIRSIKQLVSIDRYANQSTLGEAGRDFGVSVIILNANDFPKLVTASKICSEEVEQGMAAEMVALFCTQQGHLIGVKRRMDQVSIAVAFNHEDQNLTKT